MTLIKDVIPREGYCLEVLLENDHSIVLNLANRINTIRFGLLADTEFFKRATTDGNFVRWDRQIEISASELIQMVRK